MNLIDTVLWWSGFLWLSTVGLLIGGVVFAAATRYLQKNVFNMFLLFEVATRAAREGKLIFYTKEQGDDTRN